MKRNLLLGFSVVAICATIVGCGSKQITNNINNMNNDGVVESSNATNADTIINLGNTIEVIGKGAVVEGSKVTINAAGTYEIKGSLSHGQLIIDAGDEDNVDIILNGANITCLDSAAIYAKNAKNVTLELLDGTESIITDSSNYTVDDIENNEPDATIFSKCDLKIKGQGSLIVNGNYNNGITSKDDLELKSGNITVTAVNDGVRGRDSIVVTEGVYNISCGGDAFKSNNDEDTERGYITIEDGKFNINTSSNDISTTSAKGIKAVTKITINNGEFEINSADDSIHSNGDIAINGGSFKINSKDDGIHADSILDINGGNINIANSYEGLEGETININDGSICIVATDDGINAAGGNDGSSMNGRPGQNNFQGNGKGSININGGEVYVDASGDGIDSNGSIAMTNGFVIVNGPENNGNGALDYDVTFDISGGTLIAAGSLGMAQSPSMSSGQNSVNIMLAQQEANTLINIKNANGEDVLTFAPSKRYESVVVCSPAIKTGESYKVYVGGSSTGASNNGLYSDGEYSNGIEMVNFTVSSSITTAAQEGISGGQNGRPGGNMEGGFKPRG